MLLFYLLNHTRSVLYLFMFIGTLNVDRMSRIPKRTRNFLTMSQNVKGNDPCIKRMWTDRYRLTSVST